MILYVDKGSVSMKYNFDVYKMRNIINDLELKLTKTSNVEEIKNIKDIIILYQIMMANISKITSYNTSSTLGDIKYDNFNDLFNALYDLSINPIIKLLMNAYTDLTKCDLSFPLINIENNNDSLIRITDEFMKEYLPPEYYKKYEELSGTNLHIQYKSSPAAGETYIDDINKEKYILINRCNKAIDTITIPHEYFHCIFTDFTSYKVSESNLVYTIEAEGSLANLLFIDFMNKRNKMIAENLGKNLLTYFEMRSLAIMAAAYRIYKFDKENIAGFKSYRRVFKDYAIDKITDDKLMNLIGDENSDDIIGYNLSDLIAIDLFYIYKKDPEFALYLLSNIRSYRTDDNILSILRRNNLTFMDDNLSNFKKYIKKYEAK